MLRKMMEYGGYVSIVLMSHLEAIRDAADLSIDITRDGLFSAVQWGKIYPKLTKITEGVNEVKKKGRPSKSKAKVEEEKNVGTESASNSP
jgi:hypothetical protein